MTKFIAELGSNFRNNNDLLDAISMAKAAGADIIKYQWFHPSHLYGGDFVRKDVSIFEAIRQECDRCKIKLYVSSFHPQTMKDLDPIVDGHKIASCEMTHVPLLDVAKESSKDIIISTGAHGLDEIEKVMFYMMPKQVTYLHCVVSYPAKTVNREKFYSIQSLALKYKALYGYSDHTTNIDLIPSYFCHAQSAVIEKHFNPFDLKDTPDAPHSLNLREFMQMVEMAKSKYIPYDEEKDAKNKYIRRVVATADIKLGEKLELEKNCYFLRMKVTTKAVSPLIFEDKIKGRKAKRDIRNGEPITLDMLE